MKKNVSIWLLLVGLGWTSMGWAQSLSVKVVNATTNPIVDSLVKTLVGEGITVTNVRCNLSQTSTAYGTFKNGMAAVGISSGLVMTTGSANNAVGPNNMGGAGSDRPGVDGDGNGFGGMTTGASLLDALSANDIQDACVIQFDLRPASDSIEFNYVFASEEYNSFVGGNVNDIFGFFIKGPGIPTQTGLTANTRNIALIPGSTTPISINTVNKGFGTNVAQNPDYYINNTGSAGDQPTIAQAANAVRVAELQYDGLTVKLKAKIAVTPCENYTLILAIADVQDNIYDSGVFFEKGSLRSAGTASVSSPIIAGAQSFCAGDSVVLSITNSTTNTSYIWTNGAVGTSITVDTTGVFAAYAIAGGCTSLVSTPFAVLMKPTPAVVISQVGNILTTTQVPNATYQWLLNGGNINNATDISYTPSVSGNYAVRITLNGCQTTSSVINVQVTNIPHSINHLVNIYPNPSKRLFVIELDRLNEASIIITDILGRIMLNVPKAETRTSVNLPSGVYFVKVQNSNGISVQKIVVE